MFYQFCVNVSDSEANVVLKSSLLSRKEIESKNAEHQEAPHLRLLQKRLAKEVTVMVHSEIIKTQQ
jgi:tyrosyl-tRNA synthetase